MNNIVKQVLAGTLLGIMISAIGSIVVVFILLPNHQSQNVFNDLINSGLITKIITLGSLPNALVFHLLIKNRRDYIARGVLLAVVILAIVFAVLKMV